MGAVRAGRFAFPPAVFLAAFLLFQVQPLLGKLVLPWYGGTPAVWMTCLVVFQSLLFCGYAYAHGLQRLPLRVQAIAHVVLLALAATIPIVPAAAWKPTGNESPLLRIVAMLATTAGLPYLALAATGPLLQAWSWRSGARSSPYRLYALSNAGSLLALVSYPFAVEPYLGLLAQATAWRAAFVVCGVLCAVAAASAAARARQAARSAPETGGAGSALPPRARLALWVGWSACSVMLFMAVTNQLTLNTASVPFLWILPLSIYLVTFIVAFSGPRAYARGAMALLFLVAIAALWLVVRIEVTSTGLPIVKQILVYAAALGVLCLVCHGELYRLRPEPARLTGYYLAIAGGGALGGVVVSVIAPLVFLLYQELHVGLVLGAALLCATRLADPHDRLFRARRRPAAALAVLGLVALAALFWQQARAPLADARAIRRGFFGVLRVQELARDHPDAHALRLWHGSTLHGHQFLKPALRDLPAGYYTPSTGIGAALVVIRPKAGLRIGIVGLGAGTLATYGRAGDTLRFYEIDPDVIAVATTDFSFLARSAAHSEIVPGDARLSLEREEDQRYDLLVLDAFSSDSIPVHLMTREAFDVYNRHLIPSGILAVHTSSRFFDLPLAVYPLAAPLGFKCLEVDTRSRPGTMTLDTSWIILARNEGLLRQITQWLESLRAGGDVQVSSRASAAHGPAWTDDYSNPFGILK